MDFQHPTSGNSYLSTKRWCLIPNVLCQLWRFAPRLRHGVWCVPARKKTSGLCCVAAVCVSGDERVWCRTWCPSREHIPTDKTTHITQRNELVRLQIETKIHWFTTHVIYRDFAQISSYIILNWPPVIRAERPVGGGEMERLVPRHGILWRTNGLVLYASSFTQPMISAVSQVARIWFRVFGSFLGTANVAKRNEAGVSSIDRATNEEERDGDRSSHTVARRE